MSNEITVKLICSIGEICEILKNKGFKMIENYFMDDTYFIPKKLDIQNMKSREILNNAIILRDIYETIPKKQVVKLTYKNKKFNEKGNIESQSKVDCIVQDAKSGRAFIEAIGYKELMEIKEEGRVFQKGNFKLIVKDVINGDNLIEVENIDGNNEYDTIDKLIMKINELHIPIQTDNYFVKKAEIELNKLL